METRARYILVGAFTLFTLLAGLGFILWLAKVQIDRTYAQYDVVFDTVAGLGQASPVRFAGIDVGKVLTIALDRADPGKVRVRIEIYASTPVRVDTVATLASQGVTGVAFVSLEGGEPGSDRLVAVPPAIVPVIASKPSVVQGLMTDAPDLLAEAISLMEDIRRFTTPQNGAAISDILQNVKTATARIDSMATRTETVMARAETTMARIDAALTEAESAFAGADGLIRADIPDVMAELKAALTKAESSFAGADSLIRADIPEVMAELKAAMTDFRRTAAGLEDFSQNGLAQFGILAQEGRSLLATIGALVDRIGSDPGRFLLGTQTPAYRR